jgi:hypothetical protein
VKDASFYVGSLLNLPKLHQVADRRAAWRQSIAALARAPVDDGPGPLEGLHPEALLQGVASALDAGFLDDLDWLAPAAAGCALYELGSALPFGKEKRELGRRALTRLLEGDAETFVAIATRMARSTGKGLSSPAIRARIALVAELPIGLGIDSGPLALALASRRETAREWLEVTSTGSLPARRMAARLLERAAREASRKASQGDENPLRAFRVDAVQRAYTRLLADRESLVWRHVAVARGLLAPWVPALQKEIDAGLDGTLSPTEWRRTATSVAAEVAVNAPKALRLLDAAIAKGAFDRDPGIGAALIWGVPRAAEAEPDAAALLVDKVLAKVPAQAAEAVIDLRAELGTSDLVDRAAAKVLEAMSEASASNRDDGESALTHEILRDLDRSPREDEPLRHGLVRVLEVFATKGAREAFKQATELIEVARAGVDSLAAVSLDDDQEPGRTGSMARRTSVALLRDLDVGLMERHALSDLLHLSASSGEVRSRVDVVDELREKIAEWILAREGGPLQLVESNEAGGGLRVAQPILRLQRLRTLLHLLDSDVGDAQEDGARAARLRDRWRRVAKALTRRFEQDPPSPLRRTTVAALARAADALVRGGACGPEDVLLVAARERTAAVDFDTLSEASMDPDLVHVLGRYAKFLRAAALDGAPASVRGNGPPAGSPSPSPSLAPVGVDPATERAIAALEDLAKEVIPDGSGRREVLRTVLLRLTTALRALAGAPSLRTLAGPSGNEAEVVSVLESTLLALTQLCVGARARLEPFSDEPPQPSVVIERPLSVAVSRVLSGNEPVLDADAVNGWIQDLGRRVPRGIAKVVGTCVDRLLEIPLDRSSVEVAPLTVAEAKLPAWLPPHRTLGGFYVVRPLGAGAVGSVFVVLRLEDRYDPAAERFALKVPDYSASVARALSEAQFLQMFRDEASALMAVPQHPSLARFVTFDLAARPKPILVMELVEGTMLERMIESGTFDTAKALKVLDDVLAGLEAMHSVGVGHLDLKPSNVVLRSDDEAVLVDFGLAGRKVRPGCASGPYGAPEVWGVVTGDSAPTPMAVDVYAFGCLAFETLTGRVLFDAESETEQISRHIAHDGLPPMLRGLGENKKLSPMVETLFATLRRDPRNRPSVTRLRDDFRRLAPTLKNLPWPLGAAS